MDAAAVRSFFFFCPPSPKNKTNVLFCFIWNIYLSLFHSLWCCVLAMSCAAAAAVDSFVLLFFLFSNVYSFTLLFFLFFLSPSNLSVYTLTHSLSCAHTQLTRLIFLKSLKNTHTKRRKNKLKLFSYSRILESCGGEREAKNYITHIVYITLHFLRGTNSSQLQIFFYIAPHRWANIRNH